MTRQAITFNDVLSCRTALLISTAFCVFLILGFSTRLVAAPAAFPVCTDYHCDETATVKLSDTQWDQVRALFANITTPEQERQQIRQSIALLESEVGEQAGTWRDLGGNPAAVANDPGQLDCISESKNTDTFLKLLDSNGLLHWHTVDDRQKRAPWFFDTHWTAVIHDKTTNAQYAVDSWFLDNGQPPYIQELGLWLKGKAFEKE